VGRWGLFFSAVHLRPDFVERPTLVPGLSVAYRWMMQRLPLVAILAHGTERQTAPVEKQK
jgi:hypothetical protein